MKPSGLCSQINDESWAISLSNWTHAYLSLHHYIDIWKDTTKYISDWKDFEDLKNFLGTDDGSKDCLLRVHHFRDNLNCDFIICA